MRLSTVFVSSVFALAGTSVALPVEREDVLLARFADSDFLGEVDARAYGETELYIKGGGPSKLSGGKQDDSSSHRSASSNWPPESRDSSSRTSRERRSYDAAYDNELVARSLFSNIRSGISRLRNGGQAGNNGQLPENRGGRNGGQPPENRVAAVDSPPSRGSGVLRSISRIWGGRNGDQERNNGQPPAQTRVDDRMPRGPGAPRLHYQWTALHFPFRLNFPLPSMRDPRARPAVPYRYEKPPSDAHSSGHNRRSFYDLD